MTGLREVYGNNRLSQYSGHYVLQNPFLKSGFAIEKTPT